MAKGSWCTMFTMFPKFGRTSIRPLLQHILGLSLQIYPWQNSPHLQSKQLSHPSGTSFPLVQALTASGSLDAAHLWHNRLGHVNFQHLRWLSSNQPIDGLPEVLSTHDLFCQACVVGKHAKTTFHGIHGHRANCSN